MKKTIGLLSTVQRKKIPDFLSVLRLTSSEKMLIIVAFQKLKLLMKRIRAHKHTEQLH